MYKVALRNAKLFSSPNFLIFTFFGFLFSFSATNNVRAEASYVIASALDSSCLTDSIPPTITCPNNIVQNTSPGQCGASVTFSAAVSDNCPGTTYTCIPPSGTIFSHGITAVICIATDSAGNNDTCTFYVTVTDNQSPVITCPSNIIVNADSVSCEAAVVNFTAPVTDNCPGVGLICTPPSGSHFPIGTNPVNCVAADSSGNSDTCVFTVTVEAVAGDMNSSGDLTSADVVLLLNCTFLGIGDCGLCFADLNCSGELTAADVVTELNRVFLGQEVPCQCAVYIGGPICICKGRTLTYAAIGVPGGGTYAWEITAGGTKASIVGPANLQTVSVKGDAISAAANDVTLKVTYTEPIEGRLCSKTLNLTIIEATLSFSAAGMWNPDNAVPQNPAYGDPTLGPVSPGNPPGCDSYRKNIEITGEIQPCVDGLMCKYDFKRERQGYAGVLPAGGGAFVPALINCPAPNWCNDDNNNGDEDLILDPCPSSAIFVVDSPGWPTGGNACTGGSTLINSLNFREWLEVNGKRCTENLNWHASTRIKCDGTNWQLDAGGAGNVVGVGHIAIPAPAPGYMAKLARDFSVDTAVQLLNSESTEDRLTGQNMVVAVYQAGQLAGEELAELTFKLLVMASKKYVDYPIWSTPMLAIQLLAMFKAEEAIPVFFEQLLVDYPRPIESDRDGTPFTVAGNALADLGRVSLDPVLDKAYSATEEEWHVLKTILIQIKSQGMVHEEIRRALNKGADSRTQKRFKDYLESRN